MLKVFLMLAQVDPLEPPVPEAKPTIAFGLTLRDILLILGAAIVLAMILFLWAYLTRRGGRRDSLARSTKAIYRAETLSTDPSSRRVKIRKRRRHHPDNYPRNPTLGETGGLPPAREEPPPTAH